MRIRMTMAAAMLAGFLIPNGSAFAAPDGGGSATECLRAPKPSETPPGGHWYYRTDRATKRKCWFLGDAKTPKAAAAKPAKPARSAAAHADTSERNADDAPSRHAQKDASFDDARAEMTSTAPVPDDDKLQASVWPPLNDNADAKAETADAGNNVPVPTQPQPATPSYAQNGFAPVPATDAQPPMQATATAPAPAQPAQQPVTDSNNAEAAKAAQPPAAASPQPSPTAASDATSSSMQSSSMQPMLAALAGGLGLAIILGGLTIKLLQRRRDVIPFQDNRIRRRDIWSNLPADEMPQPVAVSPTPVDLDEAARIAPSRADADDAIDAPLIARSSRTAA